MELVDQSVLGFLQDSYGGYEDAEHHLHHQDQIGKTPTSKDFRGNINGLAQASSRSGSSLLSFQGNNDGKSSFGWRDQEDVCCHGRTEGDFGSLLRGNMNTSLVGASSYHGEWLFSGATEVADSTQESDTVTMTQKRPYMGDSSQPSNKKQCMTGAGKSSPSSSKPKPESSSSKDPQSVAAKNRRERISERLKILQDLVPNGNKVDLVTMLEKAISYVKFLQLQVKVLATDEFWPAQGGKAPNISQVKEAIDAILSSQRSETCSSSK